MIGFAEIRANAWKLTAIAVAVLAVAAVVAALYFRGSAAVSDASASKAKQEADQAREAVDVLGAAAEQTKESVQISRDTAARVDTEQADTASRTAKAVERIDAVIETSPRPVGPADTDVLRESREAYRRAIAAHCRVQRTSDCADAAAPAGQ